MSRFDRPLKQPYEIIATRVSVTRGTVTIIHDKNSEKYYTGIELTLENIGEGGPYGCIESSCKDDAYNDLSNLIE